MKQSQEWNWAEDWWTNSVPALMQSESNAANSLKFNLLEFDLAEFNLISFPVMKFNESAIKPN